MVKSPGSSDSHSLESMEGPFAPVAMRFKEEAAPLWLRAWGRAWIWSRQTAISAVVRSPVFVAERRGLFVPIETGREA